MKLQEITNLDFDVVSANDFAEDALEQMRRNGARFLFVIDRQNIIGIVLKSEMEKQDPARMKYGLVRDFMSKNDAGEGVAIPSELLRGAVELSGNAGMQSPMRQVDTTWGNARSVS